ncbi:hypothetical protein F0562_021517 [Nyssa sinensis]|uniref:Uncharacterized protein n=1 Tax=Nyssa sinensis TaxID=561372 RepID=A0A5J5BK37_9ASTE|nr:hypothetical protein F0562_021517 [Nyssa sinensis]
MWQINFCSSVAIKSETSEHGETGRAPATFLADLNSRVQGSDSFASRGQIPPPIVQPDQIPSASIKTPNLPSPANGVRTVGHVPHLSTPPGLPVFSSPLQPAAVPFRTSPATPQSVAFSSGSSFPTSSPPHFSNGSVELQHQVSDTAEEWVPVGESPHVLFSAHKVLKPKKLANLPSLGFGALVSSGREISPGEYIAPSKEELRTLPELFISFG